MYALLHASMRPHPSTDTALHTAFSSADDFVIKPQREHETDAAEQMKELMETEERWEGIWPLVSIHQSAYNIKKSKKYNQAEFLKG